MELWVVSLILTPIQVGFVVAFMSMVVCSEWDLSWWRLSIRRWWTVMWWLTGITISVQIQYRWWHHQDNHRHHCRWSILLILQFLLILLLRPSAFLVRLPRGVNTHQSPDYYSRQQMEKICFFWTQQFAFTLCRYFHHIHVLSLKFEHVPVKRRPPIPRSPILPPPLLPHLPAHRGGGGK